MEAKLGLSTQEAAARRRQAGKNILVPERKNSFIKKLLGFLSEPMYILLIAAGAIYFVLGDVSDGVLMAVFIVFVAALNAVQELRTDKTLKALKELSAPKVKTIRDGAFVELLSEDLVPGDIVSLSEGDKIPADGRVVECHDLGVNESALTGEPVSVPKSVYGEEEPGVGMVYAGTQVVSGGALIEITATGGATQLGRVGTAVADSPERPTPLEKQTRSLVVTAALFSIALFVALLAVTYINTGDFIQSVLAGITLMMSMIPEEFPVILTVFLSVGAWRLAKENALVRRIPSVETLGSVSVLCVDKTGTLTQNAMELTTLLPAGGVTESELLRAAAYACELTPFDPMEQGIVGRAAPREGELVHEYSFHPSLKLMGHVWNIGGRLYAAVKGSPEGVMKLVGAQDTRYLELASSGLRVLAVAAGFVEGYPDGIEGLKIDFSGFVAFEDPVREGVGRDIECVQRAGVRVVMITGDMDKTALAYARKLGIKNCAAAITGEELDGMGDDELCSAAKGVNVFARVRPEQKLRIVSAFKRNGEVTAMTGDGVNDAPALKYADIGIGMGKGSGVAREAADLVLTDDSFTTIARTVKEGRRIFANIRRAMQYVIIVHVPIALVALIGPLMGYPMILMPAHVVLLELIIDPSCSIVFERLKAPEGIMDKPPRDVSEPLLGLKASLMGAARGLMIAAAALVPYFIMMSTPEFARYAGTFVFCVLVFSNLFTVFCQRTDGELTITGIFKNRDRVLWVITAGVSAALTLFVYVKALNPIVKTTPLPVWMYLASVALGLLPSAAADIIKRIKKRF